MDITILKNIILAPYTTFKIGGPAKFFVVAENINEIKQAIKWAKQNKIKYFILGGGSNLLISDRGFDSLVIKIQNTECLVQDTNIIVDAGILLSRLVAVSIQNNLTGLEWAAGIPGTVGGAVRGNAGAFGGEMSQVVKSVDILNDKFQVSSFKFQELRFNYRDSIFKSQKKRVIIIKAEIELKKGKQQESLELIKKYSQIKKQTQALEHSSAGCVFKNYQLSPRDKKLLTEHPELNNIVKNDIISTGWLIEQCGLKGKKIGGAMVSEKHANFLVNVNNASANDVLELINIIKDKVKEKFTIELEEEIKIL